MPTTSPKRGRAIAILAAVIAIAHGGALRDGWFFDDHWHRVTLRAAGWNWHDLIEAATFDVPGPLVQHWWQTEPLEWRYARPLAMADMKLEDELSGGRAWGVHAFGLAWHLLASFLVYRLALWALGSWGWALLAGVLFAIQPHAVFSVSWTAARNAIVSGALFFTAALSCIAAARQERPAAAFGWGLASVLLWIAALFSRETAVVFPVVALCADAAVGGRRRVAARWRWHALLAFLAIAYLWWRLSVFPADGPPGIYFSLPHGVAGLAWAGSRLLQLVFSLWMHTPMLLGLADYRGAVAAPLVHVFMLAVIALLAWWYVATSRGLPGRWLWPAWMLAAFLPVIPVFMMPHFAYLPASAAAIMLAAMLRGIPSRVWRTTAVAAVVGAQMWSLAIYRMVWRGIVRSEQVACAEMLRQAPHASPDMHVFYIDLPIASIYSTVALRAAWGEHRVEGHVLTYADHALAPRGATRVEPVDDHTLRVRATDFEWFGGRIGAMLVDGMRSGQPLHAGELIAAPEFEARVLAADPAGVSALEFKFARPLSCPDYLFYWVTPAGGARRLRFESGAVMQVDAAPADAVLARDRRQRDLYFWLERRFRGLMENGLLPLDQNGR